MWAGGCEQQEDVEEKDVLGLRLHKLYFYWRQEMGSRFMRSNVYLPCARVPQMCTCVPPMCTCTSNVYMCTSHVHVYLKCVHVYLPCARVPQMCTCVPPMCTCTSNVCMHTSRQTPKRPLLMAIDQWALVPLLVLPCLSAQSSLDWLSEWCCVWWWPCPAWCMEGSVWIVWSMEGMGSVRNKKGEWRSRRNK
jgi:hypothetical protein